MAPTKTNKEKAEKRRESQRVRKAKKRASDEALVEHLTKENAELKAQVNDLKALFNSTNNKNMNDDNNNNNNRAPSPPKGVDTPSESPRSEQRRPAQQWSEATVNNYFEMVSMLSFRESQVAMAAQVAAQTFSANSQAYANALATIAGAPVSTTTFPMSDPSVLERIEVAAQQRRAGLSPSTHAFGAGAAAPAFGVPIPGSGHATPVSSAHASPIVSPHGNNAINHHFAPNFHGNPNLPPRVPVFGSGSAPAFPAPGWGAPTAAAAPVFGTHGSNTANNPFAPNLHGNPSQAPVFGHGQGHASSLGVPGNDAPNVNRGQQPPQLNQPQAVPFRFGATQARAAQDGAPQGGGSFGSAGGSFGSAGGSFGSAGGNH